jgi:putative DNA primase/helicase
MTIINNPGGAANRNPGEPPVGDPTDLPILEIQAGDHNVMVSASDIRNYDQQTSIIQQLLGRHNVVCNLFAILRWSPETRRSALPFLVRLAEEVPRISFRRPQSMVPFPNPFDLAIATIDPALNPDDFERAVQTALETAVHFFPEGLTPACSRICNSIRATGITGYRVDPLIRRATEFLYQVQGSGVDESVLSLRTLWPDFPNPGDMVLPAGWISQDNWISRIAGSVDSRIQARIVICRRLREAGGQSSFVELAWSRSGPWRKMIFPRGVLASARNIVSLADYDLPVTTNNAPDLIDYLDAFEAQNLSRIPEAIACDRMGWINVFGVEGFLVGRRLISESQPADLVIDGVQQPVEFRGADQGNEELADSLTPNGEYEQWLRLVERIHPFPRVKLAFYASFVPPLLRIFGARSFIVSLAGPTSGGKTTTLCCAAATWGCPDQQMPGSLMKTWDTTRVGIERSMQVLNDIPTILDDTKQARRPEDIAQTVYDVTGGRGRTRGSERGLAATGTWRTVMITSGEQPMASFTQDGGTRPRILEVWNSPFGQTSEQMATLVTELREGFFQHYGHAGPRFVSYLIANRGSRSEWQDLFRASRTSYEQRAGNNNVASRMAAHVAAIEVTARLVHQGLQLPWSYDDTVLSLWDELTRDAAEADRAAVAMRFLLNYCATHRHLFEGGESLGHQSAPVPYDGYVGRWSHRVNPSEPHECRAVYVKVVNDLLSDEGFEPQSMKRMWRDRGWIIVNPGKTILKMRIPGGTVDTIAIPVAVIHQLMDDEVPHAPLQPRGVIVGAGELGTS